MAWTMMKVFLVITTLVCGVVYAKAQMPPSLWKWPQSSSSYLPSSPPGTSQNAEYNGESACGGGGDTNISWSCPHLMLLSPDMQYAAQTDGNSGWAVYGVAGIGQTSDCGKCYQLDITGGGSLPSKKSLIVQAVNTGSNVSSGQFDILIGAGGFGIYDACSSNCRTEGCSGGPCNAPQFSSNFAVWTPDGNCYGGGVHEESQCDPLVPTPESQQTFAEKTLLYGCKQAIDQNYHQNLNVNFAQVQCPKSLYHVTGIRSLNDASLPLPSPKLSLNLRGSGRTTTTMDCCKPTCAWRQNVKGITDPNWPQVYVCDQKGIPRMI